MSLNIKELLEEKQELDKKQYEIRKQAIQNQHEDLLRRQAEVNASHSFTIAKLTPEQIKKLQNDNTQYLESAKNSAVFLNNSFKGVVPFFRKNLIFFGATTGSGKSTICGNICYHTARQGKSALVITNEEVITDIYNRITCLHKGWYYKNHDEFTEEQKETMNTAYEVWADKITVLDDASNGVGGLTTTFEGIQSIFEKLISDYETTGQHYEVVMLDYYQNVSSSSKSPTLEGWEVLKRLSGYLDQVKNRYPAPIVVLGQLKAIPADSTVPFKDRIEGFKGIQNVATCAIEVVAEPESQRTLWRTHKSRFSASNGTTVLTGFDRGKYIEYSPEFANRIEMDKEKQKHTDLLKRVFDNKDE